MPIIREVYWLGWFIRLITYVNKAKYLLAQNNIKSYIVKLRATLERRGCGYGLKIRENYLKIAVSLMDKYMIKIVEIIESGDDD